MILGLIPARGGSQRVKNKNMADLAGRPLIEWTICAAQESRAFDILAVTTDNQEIGMYATSRDCAIVYRPEVLALGEEGSMVRTVRHALGSFGGAEMVVLLQPTSPLRTGDHIREAIVSARAFWPKKSLVSIGPHGRPNGAIYITPAAKIISGGPIYDEQSIRYLMSAKASVDIDTPEDLEHARAMVTA